MRQWRANRGPAYVMQLPDNVKAACQTKAAVSSMTDLPARDQWDWQTHCKPREQQ